MRNSDFINRCAKLWKIVKNENTIEKMFKTPWIAHDVCTIFIRLLSLYAFEKQVDTTEQIT